MLGGGYRHTWIMGMWGTWAHMGDMGTCWGLGAQMRAMGTQWGH